MLFSLSLPSNHFLTSPTYNKIGQHLGGSDSKVSACNAGDLGLIPGLGRSPGEGNGSPLQQSCLENPMDGGAWLQSMGLQRVGHNWATSLHYCYFLAHPSGGFVCINKWMWTHIPIPQLLMKMGAGLKGRFLDFSTEISVSWETS